MKLVTLNLCDAWPINTEDAMERKDLYIKIKTTYDKDKIEDLAKIIWDGINEVDFDPVHPGWEYFDDDIKDEVRLAAMVVLSIFE